MNANKPAISRLMAMLLTAALLLTGLPVTAIADNATEAWSVDPPDISSWTGTGNIINVVGDGAIGTLNIPAAVTGLTINGGGYALTDARIVLASGSAVTLTINGLHITAPEGQTAIELEGGSTLNVAGNCYVAGDRPAGSSGKHGISAAGNLTVNVAAGASLIAIGDISDSLGGFGITSLIGGITFSGTGELEVIGGQAAIAAATYLTINNVPSRLRIEGGVSVAAYTNNTGNTELDSILSAFDFTSGSLNITAPSTNWVFTASDPAALTAYHFISIRFEMASNPSRGTNLYPENSGNTDEMPGLIYNSANGELTVPSPLSIHVQQQGSALPAGNYRAVITFFDDINSPDVILNYYVPLTITDGFDLNVINGTGGGNYAQGAQVLIKADAAPSGKIFDRWTGGNGGMFGNAYSATTTFTMPGNDAEVTATYKDYASTYDPVIINNTGNNLPSAFSGYIVCNIINVPYSYTGSVLTSGVTAQMLKNIVENAFKDKDGSRTVKLSYNNISGFAGSSGFAGLSRLTLTFDASLLKANDDITFIIETPFGVFIFTTVQMLEWFDGNAFGLYTITLEESSLKADVRKDGRTAVWSSLTPMAEIGVSYTLKSGENAENLVLTDENGRVMPTSAYEKGMVYADIISLGTYKAVLITPAVFTDTANHWAKAYIDYVTMRRLISGIDNTTFEPDAAITRAEYIMALGKLAGSNVSSYRQKSFTDVLNVNPAMPYIEWAVENEIVHGIGGRKFAPDSPITREQMAVMMANYARALGFDLPDVNNISAYADGGKISSWANDAVTDMQKADIMSGKDDNLFDPQGSTTRAEAGAVLRRFIENVINCRFAEGWSNANTDLSKRVYYNQNGNALTGWQTIDDARYYFGSDGIMRTGWLVIDDKRYYFYPEGNMIAGGWAEIGGKWYYFHEDGALAVNTTVDGHKIGTDGVRR